MSIITDNFTFTSKDYDIKFSPLTEHKELQDSWKLLEQQSNTSFFLSWDWISTWLNLHPSPKSLFLLTISHKNQLVCIGIFTEKQLTRCKLFNYKCLILHECGDTLDNITTEFNSLLIHNKHQENITEALKDTFSSMLNHWDVISLPGLKNKTISTSIPAHSIIHSHKKPHYWVNLDDIRLSSKDYLSHLSKNTRSQIKQTNREYKRFGPIEVTLAKNIQEAKEYFDKLIKLHETHWKSKHINSSFLEPPVLEFHKQLINKCFIKGHIILAHVKAGTTDLGYLYNFSYNNQNYAYQSGIKPQKDNKLRPGLLMHRLLIEKLMNTNTQSYDFMAGEYRYKKSLSSHNANISWSFIMRQTPVNQALNYLNCYFTKNEKQATIK